MSRVRDLRFWIKVELREYKCSQSNYDETDANQDFLQHCVEILPQRVLTCLRQSTTERQ